MKKILLGTTAIVSLMAVGTAMADVSLSGNVKFEAYFVDQDAVNDATSSSSDTYGEGHLFSTDDAEIVFKADSKADNGLAYGAKIEYEFENGSTDEAGIYLSGNWGLLQMGDDDGAEDIMKSGGFSVMGATGGFDGDGFGAFISGRSTSSGTPTSTGGLQGGGDTSDATKITYVTPSFGGFKAGVSYTPDTAHDYDEAMGQGGYENHVGLGAEYKGSFGDVGVQVDGRYAFANAQTNNLQNVRGWAVGGKVDFMGFSVAAGYADSGKGGLATGSTAHRGKVYDMGVAYATGPYKVAAGYAHGTRKISNTQKVKVDWFTVTGDYTVAPGLGVYAEFDHVKLEDGVVGSTGDNKANVVILGTKVSF